MEKENQLVCLYIFTHNKTGLKYFGKTINSFTKEKLLKYGGSGVYWNNHLKVHGRDISVEIYGIYKISEVREIALKFSKDNNIVKALNESGERKGKKVWANEVPEDGINDGGCSEKNRQMLSERMKNMVSCKDKYNNYFLLSKIEFESRDDLFGLNYNKKFPNRKRLSEEGKRNISNSKKGKESRLKKEIKLLDTKTDEKYKFGCYKEFVIFCKNNKISHSKLLRNKNLICNWVTKGYENTLGFVVYDDISLIKDGPFKKDMTKAIEISSLKNLKKYELWFKDRKVLEFSGYIRDNIPKNLSYSMLSKYINTYIISTYRKKDEINIGYMLKLILV